nr:hypothetical protein [Tanacetum cinerariifolium]
MVIALFLIDSVIGANYLYIRFELDMFFIRVYATIQQVEELTVRVNEESVDETDGEFPLEVYFPNSSLSWTCFFIRVYATIQQVEELMVRVNEESVDETDDGCSAKTDQREYDEAIRGICKKRMSKLSRRPSTKYNNKEHHKSLDHTAAYLEELDSNIYYGEGKPIDTHIISFIYHECND